MMSTSVSERFATRKINKSTPIPYYYQIAEILRETILDLSHDNPQDELALPSEKELCAIYDVTRGTIRHALELLEREGLLYREKGRGTFLRRRRVELDVARLSSTSEDLRARGWVPSARVLSIRSVIPRPHIQHLFGCAEDARVWETYRLRLADEEPISLQWSYILCDFAPDLDQRDLSGSLYYTLRNVYGIELASADQTIRTRRASLDEAELLQIPEGDPLFAIEVLTSDRLGRLIEYERGLWRGDRYDLRVHQRAE